MRFERDRTKERRKITLHGVSFKEAQALFTSGVRIISARWATASEQALYIEHMEKHA